MDSRDVIDAYDLGRSIDRPAGSYATVPSLAAGRSLRYFTPAPLNELLHRAQRCSSTPVSRPDVEAARAAAILLIPSITRRRNDMLCSPLLAGIAFDAVVDAGPPRSFSTEDLLAIARSTSGSTQFRQEIIFAGGRSSADARHIYPPFDRLPELVSGLATALSSPASDVRPVHRAALVLFSGAAIHPFRDGNGRWARQLTLAAANGADVVFSYAAVVCLEAASRRLLITQTWNDIYERGLRKYLAAAEIFEIELYAELMRLGAVRAAAEIRRQWPFSGSSRSVRRRLEQLFWCTGQLNAADVASVAGLSKKAAMGSLERIAHSGGQLLTIDANRVHTRALAEVVGDAIARSIKISLGEVSADE